MLGSNTNLPQSLSFVAPAAATFVVGMISAMFVFLKDLSASARRLRTIQEATNRIEFWDKYQKCVSQSGIPEETSKLLLRNIRLFIELDFAAQQVNGTRLSQLGNRKSVGFVRKAFMLYRVHDDLGQAAKDTAPMIALIWTFGPILKLYFPQNWLLSHLFFYTRYFPGMGTLSLVSGGIISFFLTSLFVYRREAKFENDAKKMVEVDQLQASANPSESMQNRVV